MKKNGYTAIITILIISAVTVAVALTVSLLAINEGQMSLAAKKGSDAFYLAQACLQDALEGTKDSPTYTGGSFNLLSGTCTITVSTAGNDWTITVTAVKDGYTKRIQVVANRSSAVTVTSWKEL